MNHLTGSQRYNDRMEKIWAEAKIQLQKYCKHLEFSDNLTGVSCDICGLEFEETPETA